ncbi:RagB/SusD family nutrient uptake outer membrane protein [Limibacter armeniacum]|uniref:RagB/SusD family nutrient uptake outer membrane protein n=1 Tax=Limibacter armeniacum TaxID=466084 RepID=UPI002FE60406
MKKVFYSILSLVLAVTIIGCSELDLDPKDELSDESFWKTQSDFEMALVGCYQGLDGRYKMFWVNSQDIFQDLMTDLCQGGIYGGDQIAAGTHQPDNDFLNNIWDETYQGIRKCNNFFEQGEAAIEAGDVSADDLKTMNGEVRLIRASQYYRLAKIWGNAPMPTTTLDRDEANSISETSYDEIISTVISELKKAAEELGDFEGGDNRLTKYGAYAYLVRVYMDQEDWENASSYAKMIIDSGEYALYTEGGPDKAYFNLFTPMGNNTKEAIVAHNFTSNTWDYSHGTFEQASMWGLQRPTARFLDMVLSKDGKFVEFVDETTGESLTPILPEDELIIEAVGKEQRVIPSIVDPDHFSLIEDDRDPRWKQLLMPFSGFKASSWESGASTNETVSSLRFIKGFDDGAAATYYYNSQKHVIRLAEIYLSYAEAQNEIGNTDEAINYVNLVRARVGMVDAPLGLTQDQAREIIRRERCVELIDEGQLYFDYKRWKFNDQNYLEMTTNRNGGVHPAGFETVVIDEGAGVKGFNLSNRMNTYLERNYVSPRNDNWPYPVNEVQINPNLGQKQGW